MDAHPSLRGRTLPVTPAQIVALGLVAASIGWAVWLLREREATDEVPLLEDTVLTAPQLATVEAALDRAQLTGYRTEGGTLWVPKGRQSAYKRAVVDADAIPKPWGTHLHEAIKSGGVWASPAARSESLKVALQDELSLVLCSMPGIERAAVLYDVEERSGFQQEPLKTASVGIRMAADCELDLIRASGIRVLVASSIAGLSPERVAVTDLGTGRVHSGPLHDAGASSPLDPALHRRHSLETALAAKVRHALGFVRGAIVDVAVADAPPAAAAIPEGVAATAEPARAAAANAPAELLPPAPPATDRPIGPGAPVAPGNEGAAIVHVTVSVPDSYLLAAVESAAMRARRDHDDATTSGTAADLERREIDRLRDLVGRTLGAFDTAGHLRILVTSHPVTDSVATSVVLTRPERGASTAAPSGAARVDQGAATDPVAEAAPRPFAAVPREAWLAATSILVGLLAGFLWWAGSRDVAVGGEPRGERRVLGGDQWGVTAEAPPDRRAAA